MDKEHVKGAVDKAKGTVKEGNGRYEDAGTRENG